MKSIAVTGIGAICADGQSIDQLAHTLFLPSSLYQSNIQPIYQFDTSKLTSRYAASIKNFDPSYKIPPSFLKHADRFSQLAYLSASQAIAQAALTEKQLHNAALIWGTGIGGQQTIEDAYQQRYLHSKSRIHPFTVPKLIPSAASSLLSIHYGITGATFTTTSACSSSAHAIAMAAMMIQTSQASTVITGGSEACITEGNFLAWEGLRVMAPKICQPFCADRQGLIIGEGSACLILEDKEEAKNKMVLAELVGIGMSSDAHNIVQPSHDGAVKAMKAALANANLPIEAIDYINAHGSGTKQNDAVETQAIKTVFGEHSKNLFISSTKSSHGHLLGASSALESVISILALIQQKSPPTRNYTRTDPECDLNYTVNEPIAAQIRYAMTNSFAFGGLNVSLIFKKVV
jgi:nodulation protein E